MRTDEEIIDFIIAKHDSPDDATRALGITNRQTLYNWRLRGIPPGWRHALWMWCRRHGLKLGEDWLIKSLVAHEAHNPMTNGGGNGRARKGKSRQAKRKGTQRTKARRTVKRVGAGRAQQRRAGRGLPTLAAQD